MSETGGGGAGAFSVLCVAACADDTGTAPFDDSEDSGPEEKSAVSGSARAPDRPRSGLVTYSADATLPLRGSAVREGPLLHLCPKDGKSFRPATLSLYPNGLQISFAPEGGQPPQEPISLAWSPFSLVQACRLHSMKADESQPWLRLFKISIFHHGITHFFATQGDKAEQDRARWVADVSRVIRVLTQSLFPPFSIAVDPVPGANWTATRLVAGYLMLYDELGVSLVYGELHAHCDSCAPFAAYEDESCDVQVVQLSIDMDTCVSERVGIDCSCFSLGDHHFSTRSCAEKMLWLRAISNVKVKLRHWASNPNRRDLKHYRASIREHAQNLPQIDPSAAAYGGPLLPVRGGPAVVIRERAPPPQKAIGPAPAASALPMMASEPGPSDDAPPKADAGPAWTSGRAGSKETTTPTMAGPAGLLQGRAGSKETTPMMAAAAARLQMMSKPPMLASEEEGEGGGALDDAAPPPMPPAQDLAPPPVVRQAELMVLKGGPV